MDETTETTSTPPTTEGESPSQPSESSEQAKAGRSERANAAMNQLLQGRRGSSRVTASQTTDTDTSQQTTDQPSPAETKTLTLTEDELNRRIQAETDRREARRNREVSQQTQAQREAERIRLLQEDPLRGAEQELARIAAEQEGQKLRSTVDTVMTQLDRAILDPLFQALPSKVQTDLLAQTSHLTGLESRAANAKAALGALEKHWKAEGAKDAEKSLRANPAFRKELLAELRGDREEPETLAAARPTHATNMNDFILSRGGRTMPYRRVG